MKRFSLGSRTATISLLSLQAGLATFLLLILIALMGRNFWLGLTALCLALLLSIPHVEESISIFRTMKASETKPELFQEPTSAEKEAMSSHLPRMGSEASAMHGLADAQSRAYSQASLQNISSGWSAQELEEFLDQKIFPDKHS